MVKVNRVIVLPDFFGPGEHLYEDQLGWTESERTDARSLVSKEIFDYCIVRVGYNFSFYYVDNDTCYGLHREDTPIELKILPRRWEEKYIAWQLEDDTHCDGEVVFSFDDPKEIWEGVKINGKSLEEIISRSYILYCSC